MKFIYIAFNFKIFLFLIQIFSTLSILSEVNNKVIELNKDDFQKEFNEIKNKYIIRVKGNIKTEDKFILIEASTKEKKNPYLSVTKKENFTDENEYDYYSIQDIISKSIRLVLPTSYFSLESEGFYLHLICKDVCGTTNIKISTTNDINLNLEEKISYYSKEKQKTFQINLNGEYADNEVAYILSGGNKKQLIMEVDSKMAKEELNNVLAIKTQKSNSKIEIFNYEKNINFFFFSHEIKNEHTIYENEYNQYFMIGKDQTTNFKVEKSNNDGENDENLKERRISVISQREVKIAITCEKGGNFNTKINGKETENISEEYYCKGPVSSISISSSSENSDFLVKIMVEKIEKNNKMAEPLMPNIYQKYNLGRGSGTSNINIHTYDNSLHNKDRSEYIDKYMGIQFDMRIKSNYKLKVYRALCKTYPFCSKENSTFLTQLFPISGYLSEVFYAMNNTYPSSNHRNILIVECTKEKNSTHTCEYELGYHKIEKFKKLKNKQGLIKYLPNFNIKRKNNKETILKEINEDKYSISLNNKTKVIVDLMVYSGDAFLLSDDPKLNDYNCKCSKYYIGQNQRWILSCQNNYENNQFDYKIKIGSNSYGAVYNIYVQEVEDIHNRQYPFEMSVMNIIDKKITITLNSINNINSEKFINGFNPINCDLKITNLKGNSTPIKTQNQNAKFDVGAVNETITYSIDILKHTHSNDKKCLFFISSHFYEYDSSYSILTEGNPFSVLLNSKIKAAKLVFPYISRAESNQVLLRVNLYNQCPLNLTIKIGSDPDKTYLIMKSKNIIINKKDFKNFQEEKIYPIIIKLYYIGKENQEIKIDLNIKTEADIPCSIKTEEFFTDIVINNNIKYYMAVIGQGSTGNILLNFKRGTGYIYARLIESHDNIEVEGWNNRIKLPNENTTDLLKFNFYEQKLYFNEKDTKKCKNNCYLLIGVQQKLITNMNNIESNNFFSEYSLFLRYFNKNETDINYIDIQNDEFIVNNIDVEKNKVEYYEFHFPNQADINTLIIDYQSENCRMTLSFNDKKFEKDTKTFHRDVNSQMFKIKKSDFIPKYDKDAGYLNIYIRIDIDDNRRDYAIFNSQYKFRIKASIDILEDIITADTNLPVYCDTKILKRENKSYCDFLININEYQYIESLGIYAMYTEKNNTKIYGKLIDSNEFTNSLYNNNLVSWPNETDNQFHENYTLLKVDIPQNNSYKLLIRIYIKENSNIELITSINRKQNLLVPFPIYFQLIEVDKNGLQMIINSENSYNIHFINLEGKGEFNFNNENYILYGEYDTLVLNTKSYTSNNIIINTKIDNSNSSNFICYMRYSKTNEYVPLERLSLNSGADFVYNEKNDDFLYYFIVNQVKENILFNLIFNKINSTIKEYRDKNVEKDFNITGYLIKEKDILDIQKNKSHIKSLKKKYEGNYDPSHHLGNIIFNSKELKQFYQSNKNQTFYILIIINKNKNNQNEYIKYIYSSIAIFSPNEIKRTTPNYLYITNHFEKNTNNNKHYYRIDAYKKKEKMYIDFSSPNKNLKYKIVKDKDKENINQTQINEYFGIEKIKKQEDVGKDLLIINKNLEDAILYVQCEKSPKENIDYTFRYFVEENYSFHYEYNNNIKIENQNKKFINISFDRIKSSITKDYVNSNYYIKVFKNDKEDINKTYYDISTSYRDEKPHLMYKLTYDDNILKNNDSVKLEIDIKNLKNYYIDIIAEIVDNSFIYDYLAYKRYYYTATPSIPKLVIYIFIAIVSTALIIGLCFVFCICFYRKSNKKLSNKVNKISFIMGENNPYIKSDKGKYDVIEYDDDDEDDF